MDGHPPQKIPCSFKLPLAYNDGKPIEKSRRDDLLEQLFIEFGGLTILGTELGWYRRIDTGQKQEETMLKVGIAVAGMPNVDRLRQMVAEIGGELDQECMYFEVSTGSVVELVPSQTKGGR